MSAVYDNWERLVAATLKKEQFRRLALINSPESSFSSSSSDYSFASSTPDVSVSNRRAQKQHQHLAQGTQDMNRIQDSYDWLLSSAEAMANSSFESLGEMGSVIFEEIGPSTDEKSVKDVLFMLRNVHMDLQELIDDYRSHIFQTLTLPSESLRNELKKVEEMKNRCDIKREIYMDMMKAAEEKGRFRYLIQLQQARDEYDEEINMFSFRTESLKQGQSHSFLTMLSRHHSAQLGLLKKAVRSLEAIEPHVRLLAEQHHIDYQLRGLEDDESETYYNNVDDEDEDEDE